MTNFDEDLPIETEDSLEAPSRGNRSSNADPAFGFVLAIALSVGLIPLLPDNADLRYTIAWGVLAGVGVLTWLLGNMERIEHERPENLLWGIAFGILLSAPFLIFFTDHFSATTRYIFPNLGAGTILAYLIFVMPLAETLFFRGTMQRNLRFWIVGPLSGLWSVILFFPVMWNEVIRFPAVATFLAIALILSNLMHSYVRERSGLAAAWLCQITTNIILFFLPFFVP